MLLTDPSLLLLALSLKDLASAMHGQTFLNQGGVHVINPAYTLVRHMRQSIKYALHATRSISPNLKPASFLFSYIMSYRPSRLQ